MFVNFTNHPSGSWGAAQRRAAQVYGEILDLPFPDVPPALSAAAVAALADEWAARILALRPACVLCQGEMTLTAKGRAAAAKPRRARGGRLQCPLRRQPHRRRRLHPPPDGVPLRPIPGISLNR